MNNKKHKNKKGNKDPNLVSVQKQDPPKSEGDEIILKPEIVPNLEEIISASEHIIPEKTTESNIDVPKKPKRNKTKKTKNEKDRDFVDEKTEIQPQEPAKDEDSQEIHDNPQEEIFITTSAISSRKKKNKKKDKGEISKQVLSLPENDQIMSRIDEINVEMQIPEPPPQEPELINLESKHSKKKNKKKKRTDSERSEKSEEVSSTANVEKLIDISNKTISNENVILEKCSEVKTINVYENVGIENFQLETSNLKSNINLSDNALENQLKQNYEETIEKKEKNEQLTKYVKISETIVQTPEKHIILPDKNLPQSIMPIFGLPEPNKEPFDILTKDLAMIGPLEEVTEIIETHLESTKPKAKIVKPVEKKFTDREFTQSDIQGISKPKIIMSDTILNVEDTVSDNILSNIEQGSQDLEYSPEADFDKKCNIIADISLKNIESIPRQESFTIISDKISGKKRKKSPKLLQDIPTTPIETLHTFSIESTLAASFDDKRKDDPPAKANLAEFIEKSSSLVTEDLDIGNITENQTKTDEQELPEVKSRKKKTKSYVDTITSDAQLGKHEIYTPRVQSENPKIGTEISTRECVEAKDEISSSAQSLDTKNTNSEDIVSELYDVTTDLYYPRSASETHLDSNNNMAIQELSTEFLTSTLVMPDTINIHGSGETPISSPEMVASDLKITEIETVIVKEEKTDLKSKMLEVNQDMEDLRLSIERSLAEFTSMEQHQKDVEENVKQHIKGDEEVPKVAESIIISSESKEEARVAIESTQKSSEIVDAKSVSAILNESLEPVNVTHQVITDVSTPKQKSIEDPQKSDLSKKLTECNDPSLPVCPSRKEHKGKNKRKKGKQDGSQASSQFVSHDAEKGSTSESRDNKEAKKDDKSEKKPEHKDEKTKQQCDNKAQDKDVQSSDDNKGNISTNLDCEKLDFDYDPIENFEDALSASTDDVNKQFEIIVQEVTKLNQKELACNKPVINVIAPESDQKKDEKINPVSQPKNLLGHPDIPVRSNRDDYKKEKDKTPNTKYAKVKIKDSIDVDKEKISKDTQTEHKRLRYNSSKTNESCSQISKNDDFVYKYSFRKVFLQSSCHVCKEELIKTRVPCGYCNLVFYCSIKHKDENWPEHQALCFAVSTIVHLKDQKHIYEEASNVSGQNYRLLRMQAIVSCEKVLKRRLVPWEQEALLYPRMCALISCREWRQDKLKDCEGCGQVSYCMDNPEHLPKTHARWCKSYLLYERLVTYQQIKGRLEPKLPTRVTSDQYKIPKKINEVLADLYEEKIEMTDIEYAALTQVSTAPITAAFCHQMYTTKVPPNNGIHKKRSFIIHVVGAELQFEADALNKWELFFLHLRPHVQDLRIVLINNNLNPSKLPLELLGKVKLCADCRQNKRRVLFSFQDKKNYSEYRSSEDFIHPDVVCAFNPSIQRSSVYNGKDTWPGALNSIFKLKTPFILTSHTMTELLRDAARIKECSELDYKVLMEPKYNPFASVRPDRNFISDDEVPLLFKNYCFMIIVGC